jgi:hypothetical protein
MQLHLSPTEAAKQDGSDEILEAWREYDADPPSPSIIHAWRLLATDEEIIRVIRETAFVSRLSDYSDRDLFRRLLELKAQARLLRRVPVHRRGAYPEFVAQSEDSV